MSFFSLSKQLCAFLSGFLVMSDRFEVLFKVNNRRVSAVNTVSAVSVVSVVRVLINTSRG
jgi:hypothetical protein